VLEARRFQSENVQNIPGRSRLSMNIIQLAVLLSGLAFTTFVYIVLNFLIHQMITDDSRRISAEAQHMITENIVSLEESLRAAAAIMRLSGNNSETIRDDIVSAFPGTSNFDHILWVRPESGKIWRSISLFSQETSRFSQTSIKGFIYTIQSRKQQSTSSDDVTVIIDVPGTQYLQEYMDPVVKSRRFVMASPLVSDGKNMGFLVGVSRVSRLIGKEWLENKKAIERLAIRDMESNERLYFMDRNFQIDDVNFETSGENFTFKLGDRQWQLNILPGLDQKARFLMQVPWLILFFGVMLTLTGTFYVRNNQQYLYKLAYINGKLAQKSYELHSEVAERERLNQSLHKIEKEYKAIIDSVSDIIFETSVTGEIIFLNNTWHKVTGFENEQVTGRNLFDLLHPQDQEEQRTSFDMLVKGKKEAYRSLTRLRTSDGRFRSVELAVSMMRQDKNSNMRVVGTITDIEERRRAKQALLEAEKKYKTIVENAAGGIYQVTPEGQFLSANPSMARILGYDTPEQLLREVKNAHDYLYVSAHDRVAFIRELETSGIIYNFKSEVKTKTGSRIWVNENARIVKDDEENILYYEGSMEDITLRKVAETKLKEAKVLSDISSRSKSEFLANMSHELRTPLNAIIGFAEIMKNEAPGVVQNRQYLEYAKDIYDSGRKLLLIINEILDASRIEAGDRQISESVINLNIVLTSCIEFMSQKAESRHLKIFDMTREQLPPVIGEELAIKQILLNLIGNAIKYTPEEGRISISGEKDVDGCLRISVTDTGIGMDEQEVEKALSPFGQIETSLNRSGSGAGLGLTLAKSLMELHGGKLEIFSQKGIGTTATIIFPVQRIIIEDSQEQAEGYTSSSSDRQIH